MAKRKVKRNKPTRYKKPYEERTTLGKVWHFIWEDNSALSWLANIILAFVLIKFIVYPLLGLILGSPLPVVAVISESMMHSPTPMCVERSFIDGTCLETNKQVREICGKRVMDKGKYSLQDYWSLCGEWYEEKGLTKEEFSQYPFPNGFDKGDVIVLRGARPKELAVGDVLVFDTGKAYPIIHRIVEKNQQGDRISFVTKGDHNAIADEGVVREKQIIGRAATRIPYIGWVKIGAVDLVSAIIR